MAEPIKQKKTPVAKLEKILLAQPNDPNMDMPTALASVPASVPAPVPSPAKTNHSGKGNGKVPAGQSVITNLSQLNLDVLVTVDTGLETQVVPPSMDPAPAEVVSQPLKKRGRKRKIALDPKYFNKDYITMWPEICMGQKVLVDRYDNVYSYDLENPRWLGVKSVFGKIDNTTETAPRTDYKYG